MRTPTQYAEEIKIKYACALSQLANLDETIFPLLESMDLLHVPLVDALAMIDDGRIRDAKTVGGLLAAERRLRADASSTPPEAL